jgi:glutamate 5-kinase
LQALSGEEGTTMARLLAPEELVRRVFTLTAVGVAVVIVASLALGFGML